MCPTYAKGVEHVNAKCVYVLIKKHGMESTRLTEARKRAGYASAAEAARALGVSLTTYAGHENGSRGFASKARRYAQFFRVDLNWLLTGRGDMRGRSGAPVIPVHGLVGASATIVPFDDDHTPIDEITMPDIAHVGAFLVRGDSQFPRWLNGERILFDTRPLAPRELLNRFAIVQAMDGRRMIKRVREGRRSGTFMLESLNAEPEHDVELLTAWRYLGTLAAE
jgi:phage repressor protein C with HTH and peptisase S24 domain